MWILVSFPWWLPSVLNRRRKMRQQKDNATEPLGTTNDKRQFMLSNPLFHKGGGGRPKAVSTWHVAEPRESQVSWVLNGLLEALRTPRTPSPVLLRERTQDKLGSGIFSGETIRSFNGNVSFPSLYNTGNKSQSPTPVTCFHITGQCYREFERLSVPIIAWEPCWVVRPAVRWCHLMY